MINIKWLYALFVEAIYLQYRNIKSKVRLGIIAFADFFVLLFIEIKNKAAFGVGCRSPPQSEFFSKKFRLEETVMAYNKAREERKWRIWKEAEEKQMRQLGVSEDTIEKLHTHDWATSLFVLSCS